MGTNYYAVKKRPTIKEPLHIGKSSAGWKFLFQEINKYNSFDWDLEIHTFEQWKEFLENNCWFAVAISSNMLTKIKYIAAYQKSPIKAVTHYAEIDRIEPYEDTGKYIIYFKGKAKKLKRFIPLNPKNPNRTPQGRVYTNINKILEANSKTTVDDLF